MKIESAKVVEMIKKRTSEAFKYLSEEEKFELKVVLADILFDLSLIIIEESEKCNEKVGTSNC
jgi:hypothetical protein